MIKDAAYTLEDQLFIAKFGDVDFIAKEVKYHHSCRKTYLNRVDRIHTGTSQEKSEQTEAREIHNKTFETLTGYIETFVINERRAEFLKSIHKQYQSTLEEYGLDSSTYPTHALRAKLQERYGKELTISKASNKEGSVLHHHTIKPEEAIEKARIYASSSDYTPTQTALQLRLEIMKLFKTCPQLPEPVTPDVLKRGQAEPPSALMHFFKGFVHWF